MKSIQLTKGKIALVSDRDYARVKCRKWNACKSGNGRWYANSPTKVRGVISMHRLIKGSPSCDVDHRNRNGLDNQRSNLRLATRTQNNGNGIIHKNNISGFKGVSPSHTITPWRARIRFQGQEYLLGHFKTKWEAAIAYWFAAVQCFGEFAREV